MRRNPLVFCLILIILLAIGTPLLAKDVDWLKVIVLDSDSHWPVSGARVSAQYTMTRDGGEKFYYDSDSAITNQEGIAYVMIGQANITRYDSRETLEVSHSEYRFIDKRFCWGDIKGTRRSTREVSGLHIESKYNPLDWDDDWLENPLIGDDNDMVMGVSIYMKRITGRRRSPQTDISDSGGSVSATIEVYHDYYTTSNRTLPCIFIKSVVTGYREHDRRQLYFRLYRKGDTESMSIDPLDYESSGIYETWVKCADSLRKGGNFIGEIVLCEDYEVGCIVLAQGPLTVPRQR